MLGRRALRLLKRWGFTAGLLAVALPALAAEGAKPEFGPNVLIFDPSMTARAIQKQIDAVYATQGHNEFSSQRKALLFFPGSYSVDVPVGFYTEVMGLGASPDGTRIAGNVHADANHEHDNATTTFWRAAEGFSVGPAGGTMQWAVSQAVSLRRMHVRGDLVLHQHHGWASGGWMSDSLVDGNVDSGSQQQWISRNCDWKSWTGSNWNMVFVGVVHPPEGAWPEPPYTKVAQTPVVREKPFLQVNAAGEFSVRVPELSSDSVGITWRGGDDQRTARPREEPDSYSGDLRTNRTDSRDTAAYSRARSGVCDAAPGERHGGDDDSRCGRYRDCGTALRCGAQRVSGAARGGTGGQSRAPCEGPDHSARYFLSRGRRGNRAGQGEFENQQQRHAGGPHVDLEGGSRQGSGLGSKYQREWASGEWKRCHDLWPVCGASPEIPGSVERQRREDLFLSVRDSLRSSEPGKLCECAGREWLGLVQAGGWSHASRGMGARGLQRLHLSECDTDPRDRDA